MSLLMEMQHPETGEWHPLAEIPPGESRSVSNMTEEGSREILVLLAEPSKAYVLRSAEGLDTSIGHLRGLAAMEGLDLLAELGPESEPYVKGIMTDRMLQRVNYRFSHREEHASTAPKSPRFPGELFVLIRRATKGFTQPLATLRVPRQLFTDAGYHIGDFSGLLGEVGQRFIQTRREDWAVTFDHIPATGEIEIRATKITESTSLGIEIDFGTRHCALCGREIPAPEFGHHVFFDHEPAEIRQWPEGIQGFLSDLTASMDESIRRAEGHPEVIAMLQLRRGQIETLAKRLAAPYN